MANIIMFRATSAALRAAINRQSTKSQISRSERTSTYWRARDHIKHLQRTGERYCLKNLGERSGGRQDFAHELKITN